MINIIRKIRLNKLGCYNFKNEIEIEIFKFIENTLLGLTSVNSKNFDEFKFRDSYLLYFNKNE